MRVKVGRVWVDQGPSSVYGGITGHHGSLMVALEEPRSPSGMQASIGGGACVVCGQKTVGGRYACSTAHQKIAYGDRR